MSASPLEIVLIAPLAPIAGVVLFWFIQLLFIESQKFLLTKIKPKHEPLCRFTNFLGILFQTICHALGFTITRSGISSFYVSVNYGKVAPKKKKQGIFEWMVNGFLFVGPFFIPSSLLLICLYFLITDSFNTSIPIDLTVSHYSFAGQLIIFGSNLYTFSEGFFGFLSSIDFLHPGHLGFFILLIFLGLGIRPSYMGEKKIEKVDLIYDLKNIKNNLLHRPIYIIILFLFSYLLFYLSVLFEQTWYVLIFSILGWLSIIAIASMIVTHLFLLLIKNSDEINDQWKLLPYIVIIASYVLARTIFYYFPVEHLKSVSILIMFVSTFATLFLLLKLKSNKFKTKPIIKPLKKVISGETDGPRRVIKQ
ncbi:MAG: hypothetical protein JXA91_00205 [Candidatus Thermoplasmatota archaeon]|nr:hypothetical protein [Candidatus Thermoplasmatota archaeon]